VIRLEPKNLYPITLLLVLSGLLVGIGVIVLQNTMVFSSSILSFNESVSCVNATDVDFTATYITSISFVGNGTVNLGADSSSNANFSWSGKHNEDVTIRCLDAGNSTLEDDFVLLGTGTYDIEGKYYDVGGTTGTDIASARDSVGDIASNWFSLIITIMVLAIILYLVIRSFGQRR